MCTCGQFSIEAGRGYLILLDWSYRWLYDTSEWKLSTEPQFSGRAALALLLGLNSFFPPISDLSQGVSLKFK